MLELDKLAQGDIVIITTGVGEEAFKYAFLVREPSKWPTGLLEEIRPDGTSIGPLPVHLHGSGRWTTRQQNPVQTQERQFTSYFDSLRIGDFLVVAASDAELGERLVFDKPGQEISYISIAKP